MLRIVAAGLARLGLRRAAALPLAGRRKESQKIGPAAEAVEIAMQIAAAAIARSTRPGISPAPANTKAPFIVGFSRLACPDARIQCSLRRIDHGIELRRAIEPGEVCWLNPDGFPASGPGLASPAIHSPAKEAIT